MTMKNVTPEPEVEKMQSAVATVASADPWAGAIVAGLDKPDRTKQLIDLLGSEGAVRRFKVVALHSVVHDDKLRPCDPLSVVEAIREAAVLGLEVYGPLGESWVLPAGRVARLQIGYRGYLKLMRESEQVEFIDAQVVYMNDVFDIEFGTAPRIVHKPVIFGEKNDSGELVADRGGYRGAYAWLQLRGTPHPLIEWMPVVDIEQVRKASPSVKAGKRSPWDDWYAEMMRKSPTRRLAKRAPLSKKAQDALAYESVTDEIELKAYAPGQGQIESSAKAAAVAALPERFRPEGAEAALENVEAAEGQTDPDRAAGAVLGAVGEPDAEGEDLEALIARTELGGEA